LDISDILSRSWAIFKSQIGMCMAVVLVAVLIPAFVNFVLGFIIGFIVAVTRNQELGQLLNLMDGIGIQLVKISGFVCFIVPGIIVGLMFSQVLYLVLDRQVPVFESFGVSRSLMVGNKGTLFLIWLLEFGLMCLGLLAFCVGSVVVLPFVSLIGAVTYLTLIGEPTVAAQPRDPMA
jgi:uncharacterized membrane protein